MGLAVVHILMMLVRNPSGACGVLDSVGSGVYGALEFFVFFILGGECRSLVGLGFRV